MAKGKMNAKKFSENSQSSRHIFVQTLQKHAKPNVVGTRGFSHQAYDNPPGGALPVTLTSLVELSVPQILANMLANVSKLRLFWSHRICVSCSRWVLHSQLDPTLIDFRTISFSQVSKFENRLIPSVVRILLSRIYQYGSEDENKKIF